MADDAITIGELSRQIAAMDARQSADLAEIKQHLRTLNSRTSALETEMAVAKYRLDEADEKSREAGAEAGRQAGRNWGTGLSLAVSAAVNAVMAWFGLGK